MRGKRGRSGAPQAGTDGRRKGAVVELCEAVAGDPGATAPSIARPSADDRCRTGPLNPFPGGNFSNELSNWVSRLLKPASEFGLPANRLRNTSARAAFAAEGQWYR